MAITDLLRRKLGTTTLTPLLVELHEPQDFLPMMRGLDALRLPVIHQMPRLGFLATVGNQQSIDLLEQFSEIRLIHYDQKVGALGLPFTPLAGPVVTYSKEELDGWIPTMQSRQFMGAHVAESEGITGAGVKVAVLDTGVNPMHPQIGNIESYTTMPDAMDKNGHGTHCATTALGGHATARQPYPGGLMDFQMKGVAPGSQLISVKVLGFIIGTGRNSDVLKGMELALEQGAKVISMSLGSPSCEGGDNPSQCPLCSTISKFKDTAIFVVAAGNSGPDAGTVGCPGSAPDALTVGSFSILDKGKTAYFSSRGPTQWDGIKPDCVAPGGGRAASRLSPREYIYSGTSPGALLDGINDKLQNGYTPIAGTSMATPHVSGLMALWLQAGKITNVIDVKTILRNKGIIKNNSRGYGNIYYDMI